MRTRTQNLLDELRSGLFLVPGVMAQGAIVLAAAMVWVDGTDQARELAVRGWVYNGGAQGATVVLSTIAGSVITVAGRTYGMTIAVLTFAWPRRG